MEYLEEEKEIISSMTNRLTCLPIATLLNITHPNRGVQYWLVVEMKGEGPLSQILNLETYHRTNSDGQKPSKQ
jgi:hypothetical protein